MKKIGLLVLTLIFCLSANGVIFADGVLIGELISGAAAGATGILIVGRSGVLISDFTGESPSCPE